jgi:hypothetical protein
MMQKKHSGCVLENFGNGNPRQGEMNAYSIAGFMVHGGDAGTAPVL